MAELSHPGLAEIVPSTVRLEIVTRRFGERVVLDSVDLDVADGQFLAILGKSGSGKTTLLKAIAGLDDDVEGSGRIFVPETLSVAFQDSRLVPWLSLLDNVQLGLSARFASRARAALAEVGLAGRERAWPLDLSGGEQQRVALARALVREPRLLLADEPFGALDALTRIAMHGLLLDLWRKHKPTVILVTHDVSEAIQLADRVIVVGEGKIIFDRTIDILRPRIHADPHFSGLRAELLRSLGVEPD